MAQVKIYGLASTLRPVRKQLSDTVHACVVEALQFPVDKRAHRFFPLEREDFFYPEGRTERYTIIEIAMIEGRSVDAKKKLVKLLFQKIQETLGMNAADIEIQISESPAHNWGFRGQHGDEISLNYKINV